MLASTTKRKIRRYFGYRNRSTGLLCAWIDSSPDLYARLLTMLENRDCITATGARLIAGQLIPRKAFNSHPVARERSPARWKQINWPEVAQHWQETLDQHRRAKLGIFSDA